MCCAYWGGGAWQLGICVGGVAVRDTHRFNDEFATMITSGLGKLEHVHHSLGFESLQLSVDTDEGSGATHTITRGSVCVCVCDRH